MRARATVPSNEAHHDQPYALIPSTESATDRRRHRTSRGVARRTATATSRSTDRSSSPSRALAQRVWMFPAVAEACERLRRACEDPYAGLPRIAAIIETDPVLSLRTIIGANSHATSAPCCDTALDAVQALGVERVAAVVGACPTYDLLAPDWRWGAPLAKHRVRSLAVAELTGILAAQHAQPTRERLRVAALLRGLGVLAFTRRAAAYGASRTSVQADRILADAEQMTIRRLPLPTRLISLIEGSWSAAPQGEAAILALACMVVRRRSDTRGDTRALRTLAQAAGVSETALRDALALPPIMFPAAARGAQSPLSSRQHAILAARAEGLTAKQIALRLGITSSSVRSHALGARRALGVTSTHEAILLARNAGWLPAAS